MNISVEIADIEYVVEVMFVLVPVPCMTWLLFELSPTLLHNALQWQLSSIVHCSVASFSTSDSSSSSIRAIIA